jgi:3-keto-disaccharide hydrolase
MVRYCARVLRNGLAKKLRVALALGLVLVLTAGLVAQREYKSGKVWPEPKVVEPGHTDDAPPSDAIVLFDGKDLSKWEGGEKWKIEDGVATVRGSGIQTKQPFGDCQLHVEWASPEKVSGSGQGRGNSGIYFMGHYEIQVLDSFNNQTYPDGSAGSLYKQSPPLVNACRKPGEWQSYDIIFTAPRFKDGKLAKPGYVTVLHNGILVQNHTEIEGTTSWDHAPAYEPHADKMPLQLQDHGNPVRYRNIWIREL